MSNITYPEAVDKRYDKMCRVNICGMDTKDSTIQEGTEFTEGHYEKIKKVYSIWICMNPPRIRENTISRYLLKEENLFGRAVEKKENYDLITAVMICLGSSEDRSYDGILKLLDVLLSSEKEAEEKKKILLEEFQIRMTKTLEKEVSLMCNLSKGVEEKGIKEGILSSIRNLMESMEWSAEQAMSALKVPETERPLYVDLLKR